MCARGRARSKRDAPLKASHILRALRRPGPCQLPCRAGKKTAALSPRPGCEVRQKHDDRRGYKSAREGLLVEVSSKLGQGRGAVGIQVERFLVPLPPNHFVHYAKIGRKRRNRVSVSKAQRHALSKRLEERGGWNSRARDAAALQRRVAARLLSHRQSKQATLLAKAPLAWRRGSRQARSWACFPSRRCQS